MDLPNSVLTDPLNLDFLVGQNTDPLPVQGMGITDLLVGNTGVPSQKQPLDPMQASTLKPGNPTAMAAPQFFDADRSQYKRYEQSKYFGQSGFDPNLGYQGNEYKYGAQQSWGDVMGNALGGAWQLAKGTFVEGWKGWGRMASALGSWDSSKLVASPDELYDMNKTQQDIMNKYAIFSTAEADAGGLMNRKFFGDMIQQSGFALGTIGQFLSEELLTMGLSTEFSLAKLGLRAPAWLGKTVTKAEVVADMAKLGQSIWKDDVLLGKLANGAKKLVPMADTVGDMFKYGKAGAGALQVASIGLGGLRRTLAEANMAFTEARMEAAGTYGDLYNKLYDEHVAIYGQAPMGARQEQMRDMAQKAASDNFYINSGILMVSNRIQFDNMFKKFSVGRQVLGEGGGFADDVLKVANKDLTKVYEKGKFGTPGLFGEISKDFGRGKAAWEVSKSLGKHMFKWETSEGLQEVFQDLSNNTMQNYYYDLYHGVKGASYSDSLRTAIRQEGVANQGLKTFLMGALTGGLLSPINFTVGKGKYYLNTTGEQRANKEKEVKEAVELLNGFYSNPKNIFNEAIANVKVQDRAAKNMDEAIANRSQYQFHNNQESAFAKTVSAAIKTDMFEPMMDTLRGFGEKMDDKQFKEAFGMEATDTNRQDVKNFFSHVSNKVETFYNNWKRLKDKYADLVIPDIYRDGTPEKKIAMAAKRALDDAIEIMATIDHKSTDAVKRAVALKTNNAAKPNLGGSAEIAFRTLSNTGNALREILELGKEISMMKQGTLDDEGKKLLSQKEKQFDLLQEWVTQYTYLKEENKDPRAIFEKGKFAKLFSDYINSRNEQSKLDVAVKDDEMHDVFQDFMDFAQLNHDHNEYIDAYNVIANPKNFILMHDRIVDALMKTSDKLQEEHKKEIESNNEEPDQQNKTLDELFGTATVDESMVDKEAEEKEKKKSKVIDVNAAEDSINKAYQDFREDQVERGTPPTSPSQFLRFSTALTDILDKYGVDRKDFYVENDSVNPEDWANAKFKYGTKPADSTEPSATDIVNMDNGVPTGNQENEVKQVKIGKNTIKIGDVISDGVNPDIVVTGLSSKGDITAEVDGQTVTLTKEELEPVLNNGFAKVINRKQTTGGSTKPVNTNKPFTDNGFIPNPANITNTVINQTNNKSGLNTQVQKTEPGVMGGRLVRDGAGKINNRSDEYELYQDAQGRTRSRITGINENYPFIMATSQINVSTPLVLRVEENPDYDEYDYATNNVVAKRTKADFFDENGKIKKDQLGEFPVAIYTVINGEEIKLGYLPTQRWVQAKDDKNKPLHVVDEYTEDGVTYYPMRDSIAKLNQMRTQILEQYNQNGPTDFGAVVTDKSSGVLRTQSGLSKLSEVVHPDTQLAIIKQGRPWTNRDSSVDEDSIIMPSELSDKLSNKDNMEGYPVVLIPTPTGKRLVSWVNVPKLRPEHSKLIMQAWMAFHVLSDINKRGEKYDTSSDLYKLANAVYKAQINSTLELNEVPNFKVLSDYINDHITYSNSKLRYADVKEGVSQITINEDGSLVAWSKQSGNKDRDTVIMKNFSAYNQDMIEKWEEISGNVYYNVRAAGKADELGVNAERKAQFLSIAGEKLVVSEPMTYNEYIMNILETNLAPGVPVDSNDPNSDFTYFSNPVVNFDMVGPIANTQTKNATVTQTTPYGTTTGPELTTSTESTEEKPAKAMSLEDMIMNAVDDIGEGLTDFGTYGDDMLKDENKPLNSIATKLSNLVEEDQIKKDCKG